MELESNSGVLSDAPSKAEDVNIGSGAILPELVLCRDAATGLQQQPCHQEDECWAGTDANYPLYPRKAIRLPTVMWG